MTILQLRTLIKRLAVKHLLLFYFTPNHTVVEQCNSIRSTDSQFFSIDLEQM
jgi:hypothetical protein